jgi:hypothetical protein
MSAPLCRSSVLARVALVVAGGACDQRPRVVVDCGACGGQGGLADPEVVTAQQQVHRVQAAGRRRNDDGDNRPGRAAAGSVSHDMPQARQQVIELAEIRGVVLRRMAVREPTFII